MSGKYVLFIPQGGLNDCFTRINITISYCELTNRTLLLDFTRSEYRINFFDYFLIKSARCNIIYDTNEIIKVLTTLKNTNRLSVYPPNLDFNIIDLFNENSKCISWFTFVEGKLDFSYKGISLALPSNSNETVILHSACGGGLGYLFFRTLRLRDQIKVAVREKLQRLGPEYLCIHVRNTDLKCNYQELYLNHQSLIHSFKQLYLCTDDKKVYEFFKTQNLNVACFTTFPENYIDGLGLHHYYQGITADQKIFDVIVDIFIATNSKILLSDSKGGFINLIRTCHQNKSDVLKMLE